MKPARRGDRISKVITARAWNALHKPENKSSSLETATHRFPNVIATIYDNNTTVLPRFSVIALGNPKFQPSVGLTEDNDPAYERLEFDADRTLTASSSLGIIQNPLGYGFSCKAVIHGVTWARVNITDTSAVWADIDTNNRLKTSTIGTIRILWKPSGLGVKQCLVLLGVANKASTGSGGACYLRTALTARTDTPNRLGNCTFSKLITDSGGNVLGYEAQTYTGWNTTKISQNQGTICQYKEASPGFFLIDVGDCSVTTTSLVVVNPVPSAASSSNNTLQINPSIGINL